MKSKNQNLEKLSEALAQCMKKMVECPENVDEKDKHHYMTITEAEEFCGLKRPTLTRAAERGDIIMSKMSKPRSGKLLIEKASLIKWIESHRLTPSLNNGDDNE